MLVTEGRASKKGRVTCALTALLVAVGALVLFALVPPLNRAWLWLCLVVAAGIVVQHILLSAVAFLMRTPPPLQTRRQPATAFIIPCLNELPSLQHTVPALRELNYSGTLLFCYVCETASGDGSLEYLRDCARHDARIVLIEKLTPPSGRGATIQYGLDHAPACEVVGFLDADHVLGQDTLNELSGAFGADGGPEAVQGVCMTAQERPNWLARLLTAERQWLERVELQANTRLGGFCNLGGGQGFLRRSILDDPELRIDEAMLLDDTDLSCRLALKGHKVVFNPRVSTYSRVPESLTEFLDQRYRWSRGYVQLLTRHIGSPFRRAPVSLALRADLMRFMLTPPGLTALYLGFPAGIAALVTAQGAPLWQVLACLLWPFLLGPGPYLAGVRTRWGDVPLLLAGIPALIYLYCSFSVAGMVDQFVLRRPAQYAKTAKPDRPPH